MQFNNVTEVFYNHSISLAQSATGYIQYAKTAIQEQVRPKISAESIEKIQSVISGLNETAAPYTTEWLQQTPTQFAAFSLGAVAGGAFVLRPTRSMAVGSFVCLTSALALTNTADDVMIVGQAVLTSMAAAAIWQIAALLHGRLTRVEDPQLINL